VADPEIDAPRLARCAALAARAAYAGKLRTVTDHGDGRVLPLLGTALTAGPGGAIAIAIDVLERQADPRVFLCALDATVLVCSTPWTGPGAVWDFDAFRAIVEESGYQVSRHEAVGPYQVLLATALPEGQRPVTVAKPGRSWTVPRYAIIPTHNRPAKLTALVASLGTQCDHIVVLDNASNPPVDDALLAGHGATVQVWHNAEQPPHLSRYWNFMLDRCAELAKEAGHDEYDVAILNDDALVPPGWYDACARGLREGDAQVAHTEPTSPPLLTRIHNNPRNRMCPHAIVVRGEAGQRADEAMRWWYFDTDWDLTARQNGGVLSVPGPRVANSLANSTTVGVLAEQAEKDRAVFEAKWSR
jgi:hypothetical protein